MAPLEIPWPTKAEYDEAILDWTHTIFDDELRRSQLALNKHGDPLPLGGANHYACVYKIGSKIVRCFYSKRSSKPPYNIIDGPPDDIKMRYQTIDNFYHTHSTIIPSLTEVIYLERGIQIGKCIYPIIKMPFIDAPQLGKFIADYHKDRGKMQQLGIAWLEMIRELEAAKIAHGDLDLTNVLVEQDGALLKLKLIDYDNLWIPQLALSKQKEYGHKHFQHPNFLQPHSHRYSLEMDHFSALVIYISIKVLEHHPEVWDEGWGANELDQLLLSLRDYRDPIGGNLTRLANSYDLGTADVIPYVEELKRSLLESRMPKSLDDIVPILHLPPRDPSVSSLPLPPLVDWSRAVLVNKEAEYPLSQTSDAQVQIHHAPKTKPKSKGRAILIGVVIVLALMLLIALVAFFYFNHLSQPNTHVGLFSLLTHSSSISRVQGEIYAA